MSNDSVAQTLPTGNTLSVSPLGYPIRRGLAQELGADRLTRHDVGLDVTGYVDSDNEKCVGRDKCKRMGACRRPEIERPCLEKLPPGHRFFPDCIRENYARMIAWTMKGVLDSGWFITLTFEGCPSERKARGMLRGWLQRLEDAYRCTLKGGGRLRWIVAQEWQSRGSIHFHLILVGERLDDLSRKRWESRWEGIKGGGFARIYEARLKAAPYLAKYTSKTQGGDLRWEGAWRGIKIPHTVGCCKA